MKILLAEDDKEHAGTLARVLAADRGLPVPGRRENESLPEAVASLLPDVVLVDMARPDRDALLGTTQGTATHPHPVVLFVDDDDPAFIEAAIGATK